MTEPMSVPVAVLLLFTAWTVAVLLVGVGAYRWTKILTGQEPITAFPADQPHGPTFYRRAVRAHANCLENLPLLTAVVVAAELTGTSNGTLDTAAVLLLAARVAQTTIHVGFRESQPAVYIRFFFFFAQIILLGVMAAQIFRG